MEASVIKLVELLGDARQYLVPLFQRPYSWERQEWQTLWNDIADLCKTENSRPHFFGAVVLIPARSVPEGVTKYSLIDGQQRYTTISLLFAALRQVAKQKREERLAEEVFKRFLINEFAEGNDYFKLLPTQSDREHYKNIILGQISPDDDSRLAVAYRYFESQIRKSDYELKKIKEAVERTLSIVRVLLDEREDPYVVFESLNAKGRSLSQADLIRNYFLMKIPTNQQEKIYDEFWRPMEEMLSGENLTEFIRHYLILRNGSFVNQREVYLNLKNYVEQGNESAVEELKILSRFSTYYAKILELLAESDSDIARFLHRLNRLEVTTAYPFLLGCYEDYIRQTISGEEFLEILKSLENFIVRRFVCGVPTNQLNSIFAPLYRQVKESSPPFVESVKNILETRGYPKDYEFERNLREAKLYGNGDRKKKTQFILETIEESFGHNEPVNLQNLQIEHIMPQTLTPWWEKQLGENHEFVHETLLDTLGNLTLTGYNASLSNLDFNEKKSWYEKSHLELNRYFADVETWCEADIQLRSQELAKRCLTIWSYFGKQNIQEQVSDENEQGYTFETMHNGDYLTGQVLELFEDLQDKIMGLGEVKEEVLKQCIVYRNKRKTFVSVVPLASGLKLYLQIPFEEVRQHSEFCRDVSNKGHWGVGDVEVKIYCSADLNRAMPFIEKAYQKSAD
ncbi:MAG: GmrSD restriction endonuclease domain-containing protein [Chlorobiales bacterium]